MSHIVQSNTRLGLYYRFKKEENIDEKRKKISEIFLKQDPYEFENFCADVLKNYYGGSTYITPSSGDYGIDIEHKRGDGFYLGQVKCYESDLNFVSIALVHSQIEKQNAKGGFVVTTGSFSDNAKNYAEDLNIELIDGVKLIKYWANGLEKQNEDVKSPEPKLVT